MPLQCCTLCSQILCLLGSSHIVTLKLVKNSSDRLSRMARRPQSGTWNMLLFWVPNQTLWVEQARTVQQVI